MLPVRVNRDRMAVTLLGGKFKPLAQRPSFAGILFVRNYLQLVKLVYYGGGTIGGAVIHHNDVIGIFRHIADHLLYRCGIIISRYQHTAPVLPEFLLKRLRAPHYTHL